MTPGSDTRPPPDLLRPSTPNDLLRAALLDWATILVCWVLTPHISPWIWPLPILLIAGRIHALGVLLHDLCHLRLRKRTIRINILEALVGYPVASTIDAMRDHHLRHHRDNGLPTDPYFKAGARQSRVLFVLYTLRGLLLFPFWSLRPFVGLIALAWPRARNAYARIFLQDKTGRDRTHDPRILRCLRAEPGHAAFVVLLVTLTVANPAELFWFFLLPAEIAGLFAALRLLLEHTYEPAPDRSVATTLAITCDHNLGWLGRVLLAPHAVGHHVVHHLHPQVGFRSLRRLRGWHVERGQRGGGTQLAGSAHV